MNKEFFFYNCCLEGRQLSFGESGYLAAKEVVHTICDSDFQHHNIDMYNPKNKTNYFHEYVKEPQDGLYLMKVAKGFKEPSLQVLFDTRLSPDFVMIEKVEGRHEEGREVARVIEDWINKAANQYGWEAKLRQNPLTDIHHIDLFFSAMSYAHDEEVPEFCSVIKFHNRAREILEMLHNKIDKKRKPQAIMLIMSAAYETGLIEKPEREVFNEEFKKNISIASYNRYMSYGSKLLAHNKDYQDYKEQFLKYKEDIMKMK